MYLKLVLLKARAIGALSRFLGQGNGVMVAGRFILKFAPSAVEKLSKNMRVVLISGTNGKSTTAKLIAEALSAQYLSNNNSNNDANKVAHNHTGANLFAGLAAALGAKPDAEIAVLEVDELVLPWAIEKTNPELVVLLNLGRDQLDRLSEVRMVSNKWRTALADKDLKVLASTDDPFVVYAASVAKEQIWFSAQDRGHIDAATCPACGALLNWSSDGSNFWCGCGFKKPDPNWTLVGEVLNGQFKVNSSIPGRAALQNAARAFIVANEFGVNLETANRAIGTVHAVDGRFANKKIGQTNFRLLLSKNPASWRETLETSANGPKHVLLVVNANTQDGKDTSWLWDVDFKPLNGRQVLVSGDRRIDVSARLTVEGVKHDVVENETAAAKVFGAIDADLIASYTAFHRLANK
jgi:UDP-N-acetylmuramyl tripeptide synthase